MAVDGKQSERRAIRNSASNLNSKSKELSSMHDYDAVGHNDEDPDEPPVAVFSSSLIECGSEEEDDISEEVRVWKRKNRVCYDIGGKEYGVSSRRWWMLTLLCLSTCMQSAVWLTWSTVTYQVPVVYPTWPAYTIKLLAAWGCIWAFICVFPTPSLVSTIGIRNTIVSALGLTATGTVLRCITREEPAALYLAHIGQCLNAIAGPLVIATPSKLSAIWFEPEHRNLITSIGVMANYAGSGVGFLLGLPYSDKADSNMDIDCLFYGEAAFCCLLFAIGLADILLGYPSRPYQYSSASAQTQHAEELSVKANRRLTGISIVVETAKEIVSYSRALFGNWNFWILMICYSVAPGIYSGWTGIIPPILNPLDVDNLTSLWLGFASTVGCVIGGLWLGYLADIRYRTGRPIKWMVIGANVLAGLCFGIFALLVDPAIGSSFAKSLGVAKTPVLFIIVIIGSALLCSPCGVFYEIAVEATYPVKEVAAASMLTAGFNLISGIYMVGGSFIPDNQSSIMNWCLAGSCIFVALVLLFFKEERRRIEIDMPEAALPHTPIGDQSELDIVKLIDDPAENVTIDRTLISPSKLK